jgi:hypothetical protein
MQNLCKIYANFMQILCIFYANFMHILCKFYAEFIQIFVRFSGFSRFLATSFVEIALRENFF